MVILMFCSSLQTVCFKRTQKARCSHSQTISPPLSSSSSWESITRDRNGFISMALEFPGRTSEVSDT